MAARAFWRRAWAFRGLDITAAMASTSCLVVAPHPDDETLGCAAAIMRKRAAGVPVTVAIVSDGAGGASAVETSGQLSEVRRREAVRACARLGVDEGDVVFLDFPDTALDQHLDEVAAALARLVGSRTPRQILVPTSCEGHPDHDASHEAVRRAVQASGFRGEILEYTVWLWTHWPWTVGHGTGRWTARRLLLAPIRRVSELRPLLVDARGLREHQKQALAEHVTQTGPAVPSRGDAAVARAAGGGSALVPPPLSGSLLAVLESRYEIYVPAGSLRHLDFDRPWRATVASVATSRTADEQASPRATAGPG